MQNNDKKMAIPERKASPSPDPDIRSSCATSVVGHSSESDHSHQKRKIVVSRLPPGEALYMPERESSETNSECGSDSDLDADYNTSGDSDETGSDMEDDDGLLPVELLQGDWVAVKVGRDEKKGKSKMQAFLHIARVDTVQENNFYTVSFLIRQRDGSYIWPANEDISTVEKNEVVKLSEPTQELVSAAGSNVRIKLFFNSSEVDQTRKMDLPLKNIR
ncbi:hypothetical protein Btru_073573 [Bulinus truncatus]|nr:hypothetical protein Btru_073573 [Bulinus truncatus]